jgi:hypothetical protein
MRSYIASGVPPSGRACRLAYASAFRNAREKGMGKYVLGWFLGIPAVVLVAIYFLAH